MSSHEFEREESPSSDLQKKRDLHHYPVSQDVSTLEICKFLSPDPAQPYPQKN